MLLYLVYKHSVSCIHIWVAESTQILYITNVDVESRSGLWHKLFIIQVQTVYSTSRINVFTCWYSSAVTHQTDDVILQFYLLYSCWPIYPLFVLFPQLIILEILTSFLFGEKIILYSLKNKLIIILIITSCFNCVYGVEVWFKFYRILVVTRILLKHKKVPETYFPLQK